jgi:Mg-chelatase subunit ChlD
MPRKKITTTTIEEIIDDGQHSHKPVIHIQFILDKSGSMYEKHSDVIGGFNKYLADRQAQQDVEIRMSLVLFDHVITHPYTELPIHSVQPLSFTTYKPDGLTALLDAVAHGISAIEQHVKPNEKVLVVTFTDGEENSSHEITRTTLKQRIEQKQALGWEFVFLGAGIDMWGEASQLGISINNNASVPFTAQGIRTAFSTVSASTSSYSSSTYSRGMFFSGTELEQQHD